MPGGIHDQFVHGRGTGTFASGQQFHPAEDFFDTFAAFLADRIAFVTYGATVDIGAPAALAGVVGVLSDVRGDPAFAQLGNEAGGIKALVASGADEAEAGGLPVRLAIEPRLGIGGRGMSLVGAFLAAEIAPGIAARPCIVVIT